ncbi:MAG: hypothetical protein QGI13_11845 [Rhodospirillales bacterium]|nr:hypothetical protein [Rhodospirillales bacterium]
MVTRKSKRPASEGRHERTVEITLHLPVETVELLRDVALAHAMDRVAKEATGKGRVTGKKVAESISKVIAELIENHAAELEGEATTVRGASKA